MRHFSADVDDLLKEKFFNVDETFHRPQLREVSLAAHSLRYGFFRELRKAAKFFRGVQNVDPAFLPWAVAAEQLADDLNAAGYPET